MLTVLAFFASTEFRASEAGLKALAVFFEAVGLAAIAAFAVLLHLYFGSEGFGVPLDEGQHGVLPLVLVLGRIETGHAITALASLIVSEAIAIEF